MITIVGGTYNERCFHPHFLEKYGSGLRGCHAIRNFDSDIDLNFHTYIPDFEKSNLEVLSNYLKMSLITHKSEQIIGFYYDHPMRKPIISPRPDLIIEAEDFSVEAEHIIYYGMMEGNARVKGKKVVYDPQSPVIPMPFSKTKSEADELAMVINRQEAFLIVGTYDEELIKKHFFEQETVSVLVLKMGPKGAKVFTDDGAETVIPVYKTPSVWPIGSGDVFVAMFGYHWMSAGLSAHEAAEKASFMTALYCNSRNFRFKPTKVADSIQPLKIKEFPKGKVYLAGPFFDLSEKWLINELYYGLKGLGLSVFSPMHDVGEGTVQDGVAQKDIDGLENCKIVFAVVDGLDSGTLFEIGYARKMGIPVIAYVESEPPSALVMLAGTMCLIESDMTTALYKCLWLLAENENE